MSSVITGSCNALSTAKALCKTLGYCQLDPWELNPVKEEYNRSIFLSRKYTLKFYLRNDDYSVLQDVGLSSHERSGVSMQQPFVQKHIQACNKETVKA